MGGRGQAQRAPESTDPGHAALGPGHPSGWTASVSFPTLNSRTVGDRVTTDEHTVGNAPLSVASHGGDLSDGEDPPGRTEDPVRRRRGPPARPDADGAAPARPRG